MKHGKPAQESKTARPSEKEFARAVEARFRALRQRPLLLSPADFRLVLSWYRDGIPLPIVLATLDDVFERAGEPERAPRSLTYCDPAVQQAWNRFRLDAPSVTGRTSRDDLAADARALLDRVIEALRASRAPRVAVESAISALESLTTLDPSRHVQDPVVLIESQLIDACRNSLDDEARARLVAAAKDELAGLSADIDEGVRARAEKATLAREVRAEFGLPDLARIPYPFPR